MDKISLLINGYGRMGKLVAERAAAYPLISVNQIVDRVEAEATVKSIMDANLSNIDLIIDFSNGENVIELLEIVAKSNPKIKIVIGSSGWNDKLAEVQGIISRNNLTVLYGANFAIGTQLFIQIVEFATGVLNALPELDPAVFEIHHALKADMPSGTALEIGQRIINKSLLKEKMLVGLENRKINPDELHVSCLRQGSNLGSHSVIFDSELETITLNQQTKDRIIYADGAIKAGLWLLAQKSNFYNFKDNLLDILQYANK